MCGIGTLKGDVVADTKGKLNRLIENVNADGLPVRATVARYSEANELSSEREVWIVVLDDLPIHFPSGPKRDDGRAPIYRNQLVITYDAHTGEVIDEAIRGQRIGFR